MKKVIEIHYLADHPEFIPLLAEWFYTQWNWMNDDDSVARWVDLLTTCSNRSAIPMTLVAAERGELRGSASLLRSDLQTRPDLTPWMSNVFVASEFRRRGIASELVRRIVLEAKRLRTPKLYLFTTGPWRERLYAGLGWSVVERPIYRGSERVIMSIRP